MKAVIIIHDHLILTNIKYIEDLLIKIRYANIRVVKRNSTIPNTKTAPQTDDCQQLQNDVAALKAHANCTPHAFAQMKYTILYIF